MRILLCHLGLGDLIVMAGAINVLSKEESLLVPIWRKNMASADTLFASCAPGQVNFIPIDKENEIFRILTEYPLPVLRSGVYSADTPQKPGETWQEWFYRQLGVPIEERWNSCPIAASVPRLGFRAVPERQDYIFWHEDTERDFRINPRKMSWMCRGDYKGMDRIVFPKKTASILEWSHVIENAEEVHVIDSAFFHLAECLQPTGKLFLHAYARETFPGGVQDFTTKHEWKIVE